MNSLQVRAEHLQRMAHTLLYPAGEIAGEDLCRLGMDVYREADLLFREHGDTPELEASLCVALLMGYNATMYNHGDKEAKKQAVLDRASAVLKLLPQSLLKCLLLIYCYGEVYEEELAQEAREIISGWSGRELTAEEREIMKVLEMTES